MATTWRQLKGFLLKVVESEQVEGPQLGGLVMLRPGAQVTAFGRDSDSLESIVTPWERLAGCTFFRPQEASSTWLEPHLEELVEALRPRAWGETRPAGHRPPGLYSVDGLMVSLSHPAPPDCCVDVAVVDLATGETGRRIRAKVADFQRVGEVQVRPLIPWYANEADLRRLDRYRGCLLGGAMGEAFGVKVARWRKKGSVSRPPCFSDLHESRRQLTISFNTQLAMFTAEGLIRAHVRGRSRGICNPAAVLWQAYQRWLFLQGRLGTKAPWVDGGDHGWLALEQGLRRIPHCPEILLKLLQRPFQQSEGTRGANLSRLASVLTRLAPTGLFEGDDSWLTEFAALTDAHPSAVDAVRFLNVLVAALVGGDSLDMASRASLDTVRDRGGFASLERGITLAASATPPSEAVALLEGAGNAEDLLAAALFCTLRGDGFRGAVEMAAVHSQDCVTAASLTGTLMGTWLGKQAFKELLDCLQLAAVIELLATDIFYQMASPDSEWLAEDWWKYPGC